MADTNMVTITLDANDVDLAVGALRCRAVDALARGERVVWLRLADVADRLQRAAKGLPPLTPRCSSCDAWAVTHNGMCSDCHKMNAQKSARD